MFTPFTNKIAHKIQYSSQSINSLSSKKQHPMVKRTSEIPFTVTSVPTNKKQHKIRQNKLIHRH